ncbi:hypothetical protein U1E44_03180 [Arenibacter sp. GZD96]|uniref:hypothetical protein n=1 Tax=Aurantibrevibacter litoralis TaxID=3106030 RepID=UPI002AFFB4BE|nr:hypothetical protein [Arenibacter sp. GZD-96]MEA1785083.1 hypothetical protein [Arenibacter sp. GZD-96]
MKHPNRYNQIHNNSLGFFFASLKNLLFVGLCFSFTSCTEKIKVDDIATLNGYWEIEKVLFSDGTDKTYKANTTIDYIEVEGLKGFRKKVQPTLHGTYHVSNDAEFFTILKKKDGFVCVYKKEDTEWEEHLVALSENHFSVIDQQQIVYRYKRYQPINITK